MVCKAPACFKTTKNACVVPNPWIVFNKLNKGVVMRSKKSAYDRFIKSFDAIRGTGDNDAYRAALCLRLTNRIDRRPIVSRFVDKLMKDRAEIEMDCKMTPNLVRFFEDYVPSRIVGTTTISPCRAIAAHMLSKCVPKDQLKYYTFQEKLVSGKHGLVIGGTYKQRPVVIKIIPVHTGTRSNITKFTIDGVAHTLTSVSQQGVEKETRIQKAIADASSSSRSFRVPKIHGNLSILKSKRHVRKRIAVIVMDKIQDVINLERATLSVLGQCLSKTPKVIQKVHELGFIHSDMHMWNVLFTTTSQRPYVVDFGRSFDTRHGLDDMDENDANMLRIMDYIVPLEMLLRLNTDNMRSLVVEFLKGMDKSKAVKKEIKTLMSSIPNDVFKICVNQVIAPADDATRAELRERHDTILTLFDSYFYSRGRSWFTMIGL